MSGNAKLYIVIGILSFFASLTQLAMPIYLLSIFDRVFASFSVETLISITVVIAFSLFILSFISFIRDKILVIFGRMFEESVRKPIFDAVLLDNGEDGRKPGDPDRKSLSFLFSDTQIVRRFISGRLLVSILDAPWGLLFLFFLIAVDVYLGAVAMFGMALILVTTIVANALLKRSETDTIAKTKTAFQLLDQSKRNRELVRSMGMVDDVFRHWNKVQSEACVSGDKVAQNSNALTNVVTFIRLSTQIAVLGTGAYLVIIERISPGFMIAANILFMRAVTPFETIVSQWTSIIESLDAWKRLNFHIKRRQKIEAADVLELEHFEPSLKYENASYQIPNSSRYVLAKVTVEFKPGSIVGIIGPSGAGKTTMLRLAVNAITPSRGRLLVGGHEFRSMSDGLSRGLVGYLPQDVTFFDGTIADNISRFADATDDEVIRAAKLAGAHEFISNLKDGYLTEIDPEAFRLSGGQKQRIGLARALYGSPPIIILDEPTSAMDLDGIEAFAEALDTLRLSEAIVLVSTHERSLLKKCTDIVVLSAGTVLFSGARDAYVEYRRTEVEKKKLVEPIPTRRLTSA